MSKHPAKKWILSFFAVVLAIVLLLSGIAYLIDPFFQFRVRDNSYMLIGWFVGSGLIENYDYDTLILGSSMIQNFDMDAFRDKLNVKPLHVGLSGSGLAEISQLMDVAYDAKKGKNFYIGIDSWSLNPGDRKSRYPEYLLKKDVLSRLRYLLSYEVWFRYIPVDIGFMVLDRMGVSLPLKFTYSKSIDRLEDWRLDIPLSAKGKEVLLGDFKNESKSVSEADKEIKYEQTIASVDAFLDQFEFENGSYTFFFPPYSSLVWCSSQNNGDFDVYLRVKQHFIERATAQGAKVYDFQCADFTTDLDNYIDEGHYLPKINDWMVECFANGDYLVTPENYSTFREKQIENTNRFRDENIELLK